ncbi:TonB-dependent receptor [Sandaracinomonas limnophila]|uniref:TonB-dependent receptor n=2 Tax=Sandaracinomonas limnophila TaxID=1862386 RepID=A0A437PQ24_9BACT|nr:TonB-dependent receptor [Sandaracinomonas limnophila]
MGFSYAISAQNNGKISGTVVDKISQKPLMGVSVSVENLSKGTTSDSLGRFRLLQLPYKSINLQFSLVGYKKQKVYNIVVNSGNENTFYVELDQEVSELQEVVVTQNRKTAKVATLESPLSVQKLTTEEIKSNPGGNFDISKVIQILPGVGGGIAGGGFRNDIIIRGGGPNENVYYLDGIEIPVLNHFQTQGSSGGPQGMLNVSFIEDVKLSSSAFDARYDNALSSVFQFRQKSGNPNKFQGNVRLSATELALTTEGPLSKSGNTTFLASARRSYLQFLFKALDIPIRPNFWDFQTKISHRINDKTTLTFMGIGAIDEFSFASLKKSTPEKIYIYNANPYINQWNYTFGFTLKRLLENGYMNLAISRNSFDNTIEKFEDNQNKAGDVTLSLRSNETENKLRWDFSQQFSGWKVSYGLNAQVVEYTNKTFSILRANFDPRAEPVVYNYTSPLPNFLRYGAFLQASKVFFGTRLGISAGLRTDMNTFTTTGNDGLKTLSPRVSLSYLLNDKWSLNASVGQYYKLPPYTVLGFAYQQGPLANKNAEYQSSKHAVLGLEYLVNDGLRFTFEGFYKKYDNVPISLQKGISLANLGSDFNVLGNEPVVTTGQGKAYGIEFFAQKKLTDRFFGVFSYTFYNSMYTGLDGNYVASSWDNRHLFSVSWGYKFPRNWELGLKFRYQGGAPYTPYDAMASQMNYLTLGQGIFDYTKLNTQRLRGFHSSDVRIDKKYNYKHVTLDLFMDVTNWYVAAAESVPYFTFKRNEANTEFVTTDGKALQANGSNAIPTYIVNDKAQTTPTIGFIVEF